MKRMQKRAKGGATTFCFLDPSISDAESAVRWIAAAAKLEGFEGKSIALLPPSGGSAEDGSIQLSPASTPEALMARLEGRTYERIYIEGKYEGIRIGLGVDLAKYEIAVTVPEEHMKLIGTIVERLNNRG